MLTLPEYVGYAGVKPSQDRKSKLECVNEENLNFLRRCNATFLYVLYQNGPVTDISQFEESKRIAAQKRSLLDLMKKNRDLSLYKEIKALYLKEKELHAVQNAAIKDIQARWKNDCSLLHFSNAALSSIAFEILPAVNAYIEFARAELHQKHRSVPEEVKGAVLTYCTALETWSEQIKHAVVEAMTERLVSVSTHSVIDKLHFNQFFDVLETERSNDAFKKIQTLNWAQPSVEQQNGFIDGKYLLVPKPLAAIVPKTSWRRARATVQGKETIVEYLAKHRYTFAMSHIHHKPIDVINTNQGLTQITIFTAQLHTMTQELKLLDAARPTSWIIRLLQPNKTKRIDTFRHYWQNELKQLVDFCIRAFQELWQQWQTGYQLNHAVNFSLQQQQLITAIANFTREADVSNGMGKAQRQALKILQSQYASVYEHCQPERGRIQNQLEKMAKGNLENGKSLHHLEDYLEDLRDKSNSSELRHFLESPAVKSAVAGIFPISQRCLETLANAADCLSESDAKILVLSVYWVLQLGTEKDKTNLQNQLDAVRQQYLSYLATVPAVRSTTWFTQCETLLITLYAHIGDLEQTKEFKTLQSRRLQETQNMTSSATLQQDALELCTKHEVAQWQAKCIAMRDNLAQHVWSRIDAGFPTHTAACHHALMSLVSTAVAAGKSSIAELTLTPYQKNL